METAEVAAWSLGAFAVISFVIIGYVIVYISRKNKDEPK